MNEIAASKTTSKIIKTMNRTEQTQNSLNALSFKRRLKMISEKAFFSAFTFRGTDRKLKGKKWKIYELFKVKQLIVSSFEPSRNFEDVMIEILTAYNRNTKA